VLRRWPGSLAALLVTLLAAGLVIDDVVQESARHWWVAHPFTTTIVGGLLVLAFTVLVADQVVALRAIKDRARAIAAQSAIVSAQASRAVTTVIAARDGTGEQSAASDEVRTYLSMLLTAAPVLLNAKVSRTFLEEAQRLAAELSRTLSVITKHGEISTADRTRLDQAVSQLRAAAEPLLSVLNPAERQVIED